MDEFRKLLVLKYIDLGLSINGFGKLKENTGLLIENIDYIIDILYEEKFIEYKNYALITTKNGKIFLEENYMNEFKFNCTEYLSKDIGKQKCMNINDIYIPKSFTKKISYNQHNINS